MSTRITRIKTDCTDCFWECEVSRLRPAPVLRRSSGRIDDRRSFQTTSDAVAAVPSGRGPAQPGDARVILMTATPGGFHDAPSETHESAVRHRGPGVGARRIDAGGCRRHSAKSVSNPAG